MVPRALAAAPVVTESSAGGALAEEKLPALVASGEFDAVYAENAEFVWRSLARLGVPESALPDALQEVFLVAYRRLDRDQPPRVRPRRAG